MADSKPTPSASVDPAIAGNRHSPESVEQLSQSLHANIDSLAAELRARWNSGRRCAAESLAEGSSAAVWQHVAADDEMLLDLLYHELLIREEFGEHPKSADFTARFPRLSDRLQRLFAVHAAIEDDSLDDLAMPSARDEPDLTTADDRATPLIEAAPGTATRWPRRGSRLPDPPPGYELIEELGRGGMAVVYRARQLILNREVALKMLLGGGMASSEVLARIRQEARAVAQLQHPGIVQIFDVDDHHGLPYLSLELVPGGTLQDWLKGQPLAPDDACRIVERLALIMQFAHDRGVVHRDLKPANVLLTTRPAGFDSQQTEASSKSQAGNSRTPDLKIGDFGLARVAGHHSDLTATGQIIGTPSYMAPEQAAGTTDDASPSQDIYSLGAILYELLTGRPPFRGATLFDTLEQVRTDEPIPLRRLQPRVPADLETVCLKCLEKTPERRYHSAGELADELHAVLQGESIKARPAGPLERFGRLARRHPATTAMTFLAVLVAVAGITGILIENRRANQREQDASLQRDRAVGLSIVAANERDEARRQRQLAVAQTIKADQQFQQAELQRTAAEAARSEAVIARQQAEASLDESLAAVNSLSNFGMELRADPRQQLTSNRILDETLKLYDRLEAAHGDNTRLRRQLASTLVRAGEIRSVRRETAKAQEHLERSARLLAEEHERDPADLIVLQNLAKANWLLGNLLKGTFRADQAYEPYLRSLAATDKVLQLTPDDRNHRLGKANIITNICAVLNAQGKSQEALSQFEAAISILRDEFASDPTSVMARSELALVLHDQSGTLRGLNRPEEADRAFAESLALRQQLHAERPDDVGNRLLYSRLFLNRGQLLRRAGKLVPARDEYRQAVELLEPPADQMPEAFEYQHALHNALIAQLDVDFACDDPTDVEDCWSRLTTRLLKARRQFPLDRTVVVQMQAWLPDRCEHLIEAGRSDAVPPIWKDLQAASEWLVSDEAANLEPLPTIAQRAGWLNSASWYLTSSPLRELNVPARAQALAEKSLELQPDSINTMHTLATACYEQQNFAEALAICQRAAGLEDANNLARQQRDASFSPRHDPELRALLVLCLWNTGDHATARELAAGLPVAPTDMAKDAPRTRRMLREVHDLIPSN